MKTAPGRAWLSSVRALRNRPFRALWIAFLVSSVGTWMQIVAQSLLVLRLSHGSAFALGCVSLCQASAFFLFALVGGSFADRLDRRRLLIVSQSTLMLLATTLGFLTLLNLITVSVIAGMAFLSGVILSFDQPARAALISTLVPQEDLVNAISLQSAVFNGASVAGPALAGLIIDHIGLSADFFLNALSFGGVIFALALLPTKPGLPPRREKLIRQIKEGLRSVQRDSLLLSSLTLYGMLLFAGPSLPLLLPVLAVGRLHITASTLGFLFAAAGFGAVLGALILGSLHTASLPLARAAVVSWCIALAVAGTSTSVPLTFCALLLLGTSQSIVGSTTSTLLQTRVPPQQRGRVMSLNSLLVMGVRPLGDFPAGALISGIGASFTAVASAAMVGVTGLVIYRRSRLPSRPEGGL
ncbi:MAG: MFS transporter [Acidobacteriaceae bacterium]|nr:MFS transporter [Acidobacteriaceae bacterium]MBV8572916.1 MFS transporter [Acidobacteriaceae bacterium]